MICSIFINPTQFNNENDFNSYPNTIDEDISKLENIGCNLLFLPEVQEIYPKGLVKKKIVNNFRNILLYISQIFTYVIDENFQKS